MTRMTVIFINISLLIPLIQGCSDPFLPGEDNSPLIQGDYYIAPWGNDLNPGTEDKPWLNLQRAIALADAGDTIVIRGGTYYPAETIEWFPSNGKGKDGKTGQPVCFLNQTGETPVFDFGKYNTKSNYATGIYLNTADYIYLKGITVKNVKQPRDFVECLGVYAYDCTNLTFENITVNSIDGNAFRHLGGWRYPGSEPYSHPEHATFPGDTMRFINCDAYDCCDSRPRTASGNPALGGAGDGFKTNDEAGAVIIFEGCRAWNCSDDGFDPSGPNTVIVTNCWSFYNGRLDGDGTEFKTGAVPVDNTMLISRFISNCIAASNRERGFMLLRISRLLQDQCKVL